MKLTIHSIIETKPLSVFESNKIVDKMTRKLKEEQGNNAPYRFNIGDAVADKHGRKDVLTDRYRENGHNFYAGKYFYREQDLNLIKKKEIQK